MAGPSRADAQRNRQQILTVAAQAFADDGLSVSVQEIARRAGVGTGTVGRHFPTKEDLFEAILCQRMDGLVAVADDALERSEPGPAFFEFVESTVRAGAADRGFADRLAAAVGRRDLLSASTQALCDQLERLLARAQDARAVRADVDLADVEALMVACMGRPRSLPVVLEVVRVGLAC